MMSYEYRNKRMIENFVRRYTTNVSDEVDILFELEHVYSQAAKADEYEAKAKAWDKLMVEIERITEEATVKGLPPKTTLVTKVIAVTMAKREYESGESE